MKKGVKIAIGASVAVLVGYLAYRYFWKKNISATKTQTADEDELVYDKVSRIIEINKA